MSNATNIEMEINSPNNWGNLIHALSFADKAPDTFSDMKAVLLRIAKRLSTEGPLESQLRQRQVREVLRQRGIRGAAALLKAARAEIRKTMPKSGAGKGVPTS